MFVFFRNLETQSVIVQEAIFQRSKTRNYP